MVSIKPNIANVVGVVSRFMSNPGKQNWVDVKWILKYLKGTTNCSLYFRNSDFGLHGYVDASIAGDIDGKIILLDLFIPWAVYQIVGFRNCKTWLHF